MENRNHRNNIYKYKMKKFCKNEHYKRNNQNNIIWMETDYIESIIN